jgi:hypothetical protein
MPGSTASQVRQARRLDKKARRLASKAKLGPRPSSALRKAKFALRVSPAAAQSKVRSLMKRAERALNSKNTAVAVAAVAKAVRALVARAHSLGRKPL